MSVYQDIVETETIVCMNCSKEVPKMLFCPNCGYPLYIEKNGERSETEDEKSVEQDAQPDEAESVSDIEEKDETIPQMKMIHPLKNLSQPKLRKSLKKPLRSLRNKDSSHVQKISLASKTMQ
jgi:uncharacterized Zn finger protein (UPF0148 family)